MAAFGVRPERASEIWRPIFNDTCEIHSDPLKGRGVFARRTISAGTVIETAPVILVNPEQCALLDQTILHDYYFAWDDAGCGAVALGLISVCNHSRRPNARVRRNQPRQTLDLVAAMTIAAGTEITIDYACPLWFRPEP